MAFFLTNVSSYKYFFIEQDKYFFPLKETRLKFVIQPQVLVPLDGVSQGKMRSIFPIEKKVSPSKYFRQLGAFVVTIVLWGMHILIQG